jgi:hypothetical protein
MYCFVVIDRGINRLAVFAMIKGEGMALSNYRPGDYLVIVELAQAGFIEERPLGVESVEQEGQSQVNLQSAASHFCFSLKWSFIWHEGHNVSQYLQPFC